MISKDDLSQLKKVVQDYHSLEHKQNLNWETVKDRAKKLTSSVGAAKGVSLKNISMGFAKIGRRKAIWPLLLEKAFAKIHGS